MGLKHTLSTINGSFLLEELESKEKNREWIMFPPHTHILKVKVCVAQSCLTFSRPHAL